MSFQGVCIPNSATSGETQAQQLNMMSSKNASKKLQEPRSEMEKMQY